MKFKPLFALILAIIVINTLCKTENSKTEKKHKHLLRKIHKHLAPNKTAGGNNTNSTNTTIILNSVGRKVYVDSSKDIVLTKPPFSVSRCDQVITFPGKFIPNLVEYRARKEGFFTITAHYCNLFAKDNPSNLLRTILLSETNIMPQEIMGSGGCIMVYSRLGGNHNIPICLDNHDNTVNILETLKTFAECRGGIGINNATEKVDPLKVTEMVKSCSGKGKYVNPAELIKKMKLKTKKVRKDKNWWHPGSDNVPGTGRDDNYKEGKKKSSRRLLR